MASNPGYNVASNSGYNSGLEPRVPFSKSAEKRRGKRKRKIELASINSFGMEPAGDEAIIIVL